MQKCGNKNHEVIVTPISVESMRNLPNGPKREFAYTFTTRKCQLGFLKTFAAQPMRGILVFALTYMFTLQHPNVIKWLPFRMGFGG